MTLEIECVWQTEETKKLEAAGMPVKPEMYEHRTITFFRIDAVSPYDFDTDYSYTKIHVGNDCWIAPYSYDVVLALIEKAKRKAGESVD